MKDGIKTVDLEPTRIWFPNVWQVVPSKNDSYFHALFVGLTSPLVNLPHYVWLLILSIGQVFWMFAISVLAPVFYGLLGRVNTYNVPAGFACIGVKEHDNSGGQE